MDANQERTISKVVAKAWMDRALYQHLLTDPKRVLQDAGVVLGGIAVVVVVLGMGQEAAAATLKQESDLHEQNAIVEVVLPPKPMDMAEESFNATGNDAVVVLFTFRGCVC